MDSSDETGWLSLSGGGGAVVEEVEGAVAGVVEVLVSGGCGAVQLRWSGESVVGCEKRADMIVWRGGRGELVLESTTLCTNEDMAVRAGA